MKLTPDWRRVLWRSATTRVTAAMTFLVGALSQTYMAGYAFLAFLPYPPLQVAIAGLITAIVVGGPIILARLAHQPKLQDTPDGGR